MKRIIKFFALVCLLIFVCGCNKKLVCEKKISNQSNKVTITFDENDKPLKAIYEIKYTYDSLDAYIDMKLLELQEEYVVYDNIDGLTYKIKEDNNDLIIKFNLDYSLYDNRKTEIPIILDNLENNKNNLENLYYICK